jgi:hypothetical protein
MNNDGHAANTTLPPFSHLPLPLATSYMASAHSSLMLAWILIGHQPNKRGSQTTGWTCGRQTMYH